MAIIASRVSWDPFWPAGTERRVGKPATKGSSSLSVLRESSVQRKSFSIRCLHQENMKSACDPLSKAYAPLDARKAFKSAKKVRSLIGLGLLPYQSR